MDVKYNGKDNSKGIPFIFFVHVVNYSSDILQINNLTKIFLDCQFSNVKIAQVSDDNVDTVRTHDVAGHQSPTSWVHYTTSCNTQSSATEDGQNNCPKHVELTGIINKLLLLHLVGCLYCLCLIKFF